MRNTILVLLTSCTASAQATDWLQFGYDPSHSGYNRAENGYSTALGNATIYHYSLPNAADSAPVYLGNVATAAGNKNILFVVSKNGTLLALDADSATLNVLWSKQPTGAGTLTTGSPVVDPGKQYVYAYGLDGYVHKYQVGNGVEVNSGGWPELSTLKPDVEKSAAGLSIATTPAGTYLYAVTNGYIGDGGDYQGHLTAVNLADGSQKVFNSLCSALTIHFVENGITGGGGQNDCAAVQSGIWGRPGAVYDGGTNRVFITTGNSVYDPAQHDWGDTVLALNPQGTGSGSGNPVDSYTPSTYANLNSSDADLGSNAVALVPAPAGSTYTHLGVIAGKDGCVRLIRLDNMSGSGGPGHTGGSLQSQPLDSSVSAANCNDTTTTGGSDAGGGEIRAQPAVWVNPTDASIWVYVTNLSSTLAAYKVAVSAGVPSLAKQWTSAFGAGTSPIVANGTMYYQSLFGNNVIALDASTGALNWQSASTLSGVHWQSPILVNGRIYAIDDGGHLWAFELDGLFKNGFQ